MMSIKMKSIFADIGAFASILLVLIPISLETVANQVGANPHPLSFFIGPALYSYGAGLIPNVDYFSQYGTGVGALFSYFLNNSPMEVFKASILITVSGTVFFALTFYLLAKWVLDSRVWAFFLTLIALILNFSSVAPFTSPSLWPIRYPFLALFCLLFIVFCKTPVISLKKIIFILLGLVAGISLFWSTEIGISIILPGAFCIWFNTRSPMRAVLAVLMFFAVTGLAFIGLSVFAFGTGVLHINFIMGIFKPAIMYGSGFGAFPVNWLSPAEFLFNVLIPVVLVTTVIWGISSKPLVHEKQPVLLLIAFIALMQLTKFWNMSLATVWLSNSYLPLLIFMFWLRTAINNSHMLFIRNGLSLMVLSVGIIYIFSFNDPRMPSIFGVKSYQKYPSVLMGLHKNSFKIPPTTMNFSVAEVAHQDVMLIQKWVLPGERAYIYSSRDWVYLLRAQRAPGFPFIPSTMTPLKEQGEKPLSAAKIIFFEKGEQLWGNNVEMATSIQQRLRAEFVLVATGIHLDVYQQHR